MTSVYDRNLLDDGDMFPNTRCLFQKYDGSSLSTISSCSRSSRGSENISRTRNSLSDMERGTNGTTITRTQQEHEGRYLNRIARDFSSSSLENSPTEINDEKKCEMCGGSGKYRWCSCNKNSRLNDSSHLSPDNNTRRYSFYSGAPSYERGSWRRRYRAERSTEIDLTPLLDVLKRIDNINTSMGIPLDAYTKYLPRDNDDDLENNNETYQVIERSSCTESSVQRSPDSFNLRRQGEYTKDRENTYSNTTDFSTKENNIDNRVDKEYEYKTASYSSHSEGNDSYDYNDNNNNSDSDFDRIFDDAVKYNMNTNKHKIVHQRSNHHAETILDKQKIEPRQGKDVNDKNSKVEDRKDTHAVSNGCECESDSSSLGEKFPIKTTRKRRKSKGVLNNSFLATRSRRKSIEKDTRQLHDKIHINNNIKNTEKHFYRENTISNDQGMGVIPNGTEPDMLSVLDRAANVGANDRKFHNKNDLSDKPSNLLSKRDLNEIQRANEMKIKLDGHPNDGEKERNFCNESNTIDSIPGTYEEFNKSLEEASKNGAMKRSSIETKPANVNVVVTNEMGEPQTPETKPRRRSSVSKLTAFWNNRFASGQSESHHSNSNKNDDEYEQNIPDTASNNASQIPKKTVESNIKLQENAASTETCTDEDEKFRRIQLKLQNRYKQSNRLNMRRKSISKQDIPRTSEYIASPTIKKTFPSNFVFQENVASTETGTDEDEKFRRIQSKLQNRSQQSNRINMRRRSILKNKEVTSSFLNEFLTVPAARTRNSDSESGSNSQQSIKCDRLLTRRVSFQTSVANSTSESESHSDENGIDNYDVSDNEVAEKKHIENTGKCGSPDGVKSNNCNSGIENAENEHVVWREYGEREDLDSIDPSIHLNRNNVKSQNEFKFDDKSIEQERSQLRESNGNKETHVNLIHHDTRHTNGKHDKRIEGNLYREERGNEQCLKLDRDSTTGRSVNSVNASPETNFTRYRSKSNIEQLNLNKNVKPQRTSAEKSENESSTKINDSKIDDHTNGYKTADHTTKNVDVPSKRRPRAKLFSVAGEDGDDDEYASLLNKPVELNSSDSSDVELSWRTRGYSADFYMSRKSTTGSEIIDKFRKVMRKRTKDNSTRQRLSATSRLPDNMF